MDYTLDTHLGSGAVTFTVDARRLIVAHEKTGERRVIAFSGVKEINLRQDIAGVYNAVVHHDDGRPVTIPARHFLGIGRFETRSEQYAAFVEALSSGVRAANPGARLVAGSSLLFYLGLVLMVLVAVFGVMLVAVVFMRGRMPPLQGAFPILLGVGVGAGFVAQGRAKPYEPGAIPPKFLPPRPRA